MLVSICIIPVLVRALAPTFGNGGLLEILQHKVLRSALDFERVDVNIRHDHTG